MERFLTHPNLPEGNVSAVILGSGWPDIAAALRGRGIFVYELPENRAASAPVAGHADLSVYDCGGGLVIASEALSRGLSDAFPGLQVRSAQKEQGSAYPEDISLNACRIGDRVFCFRDATEPEILEHIRRDKLSLVPVKQGYARCSVCILDEQHLITADPSIAAAAEKCGMDVLRIQPGGIELPGYEYGFIGGACFKSDRHTICFTGHLNGHKDESRIYDYIKHCGYRVDLLTDLPCTDVGSIIPMREII